MRTSIYSRCPACRKDGLVQPVQDTYRCACCNFDYRTLAKDQVALEAWMLENLRLGPMLTVFMMHLHQMILALPLEESNARVRALALKNGIALPTGKPISVRKIVVLAIGVVILFIALIAIIGLTTR